MKNRLPIFPDYQAAFVQKSNGHPLGQLEQYYMDTYLPGLLVAEDKTSMAHSLETRVPLWSQELVNFVSRIPISLRMRRGELKGLLKDIARPWLPDELFSAPKRGFPTPLRLWFRDSLATFVKERLLDTDTLLHSLVPKSDVEALVRSHQSHPLPFPLDERRAHRIWILLCLESWIRQFKLTLPIPS